MNDSPENLPAVTHAPAIQVHSNIPVLDSGLFEHMKKIATTMARTPLVPVHLKGDNDLEAAANMFLVVNQAIRWNMDPFALAQHAYVLKGKLGYEGKVVAAIINASLSPERLKYGYSGEGKTRSIKVSADGCELEGSVASWATSNDQWKKSPESIDQMLAYRGAREWARRFRPEIMLGVMADDDIIDAVSEEVKALLPPPPPPPAAQIEPPQPETPPAPADAPEAPQTDAAGPPDEPEGDAITMDDAEVRADAGVRMDTATTIEDLEAVYNEVREHPAFEFPTDRQNLTDLYEDLKAELEAKA